ARDWSSDVCSSDLIALGERGHDRVQTLEIYPLALQLVEPLVAAFDRPLELQAQERGGHRHGSERQERDHHLGPVTRRADHEGSDHRSEEHTSELQSRENLVCRLLLEKKKTER